MENDIFIHNLSTLYDFVAAARWSSFKIAAKELHKTPSAVSQQIKILEDQLGFLLFIRHPRKVQLTEKGLEFYSAAAKILSQLDDTVKSLRSGSNESILRITTTHSFSMKWLVPRLSQFNLTHPMYDIQLDASDLPRELNSDPFDVAIRYQKVHEQALGLLMYREQYIAVYSSKLLGKIESLKRLNDLALLYNNTTSNWISWLKVNNALVGEHDFSRSYSHSGILVEAAVNGHGVALVPYCIVFEDLKEGRLQQLEGTKNLTSDYGYYLLHKPEIKKAKKLKVFEDWLKSQFREMNE